MTTPDSPSTPDRSFANIPVLPPPKRSVQKSPKSPTLPFPPIQSPLPSTPKSALRFPQLEPRSRSNSNTSNRSRSPSPLRKVVFSPKEELITNSKENLPSLSDLRDLNQRELKELKDKQHKDFGDFLDKSPPKPPLHLDTEPPRSPKGRSKSVGADPLDTPQTPQTPQTPVPNMTVAASTGSQLPSFITPVSTAFSLGLVVGLSISAIRPTLEKAVDHGSSWLAWAFKTLILWTTIAAAAYMAFTLGKAVLLTVQQNQQKAQNVHQLPPTPRSDPFEGLKPHKSSSGSTVSSSSSKSSTSTKSSGSAASIYEFNKYVDEQKVKRRGQKDEEHSFRPYPARPQLSSTAPGKIYGNMK